ncbi:MAG: transcription antitermination factor NusB [Bacteroidetes bacterium]|nr:transcription antitermination factor NusB [Bacteroidota bacterium]
MSTTKKITRREVREKAMQVLYAYEISREPIEMLLETIAGEELNDEAELYRFAQALVYSVLNHRAEADMLIREKSQNWNFDRIATLDIMLLRMGIVEFIYFPEIPVKVTINECVDIAKRFSTEQSGRFINGMLDSIQSALREQNRIKKEGRGLVDK